MDLLLSDRHQTGVGSGQTDVTDNRPLGVVCAREQEQMAEIGHSEVKRFAAERVNLPKEDADRYRAQVKRLGDRLTTKIDADPSFDLVKMLHSGSVAKGTALKTVNDLDVAVYVKAGSAPKDDYQLQPWLADRLHEANPNMNADQFVPQDHCVRVHFNGSGLDVDVVPVIYEGAANDCGYLVRKNSGERVMTSVTLHLKFLRDRKAKYGDDFKQLIRLIKWWKKMELRNDTDFRFKSFMIELICAHLADTRVGLGDYPEAMKAFFTYVVKSELRDRIVFTDNYAPAAVPSSTGAAIEVFDPVNAENNVAKNYCESDRKKIVEAAHRALDALGEAAFATTRGEAIECWQDVLGPSFKG
jgi:tRNA nucleotidyltransferase (CCA-adding enzyme)